ncbi:N-acetylmuramoyl-L-alanine amidase [Streptomyces sp. NPDC051569]|uniref:N-acetylmuramoyl-L-alanine amidase n=1 Tax=Streptomyces sp. NPDC051569 TaxID=3365661 RepID=UPI0037AD5D91
MRAYLATSIGVACTAALVLPLSLPPGAAASATGAGSRAVVPGSTQSLPLAVRPTARTGGAVAERGLARRDVRDFSLLGVVWDDADEELHGTVQVRTRATGTHAWSGWQLLETHNQEHGADPDTDERRAGTVHGSTAPLWVGDSDGVELRVRAVEEPGTEGSSPALLPRGLRLDLVDPGGGPAPATATPPAATPATGEPSTGEPSTGEPSTGEPSTGEPSTGEPSTGEPSTGEPPAGTAQTPGAQVGGERGPDAVGAPMTLEEEASSAVNADLAEPGATEIPELSKEETEARLGEFAKPYIGPRPRIITRKGWGADERLRERKFGYTQSVKAAFVHHSATGNNYTCAEAPSVLRGIYRYHVKSSGWRDFGYNFAIDKCGNIYEGRAGGVAKAVMGAHTLGFNTNSTGIVVLGTYSGTNPPAAATTAIARLTAWKLGLYGVDPAGKVTLTSGGSNKYKKGTKVKLNAISGHRDGFVTECPGRRLYGKLGATRTASAKYQGR